MALVRVRETVPVIAPTITAAPPTAKPVATRIRPSLRARGGGVSTGVGAGTIGLLALAEATKEGVEESSATQKRAIHVELSTDNLDGLYESLTARGVTFHQPPHDEPWERSMTALDPDGYSVEFAQGRRGKNQTKP